MMLLAAASALLLHAPLAAPAGEGKPIEIGTSLTIESKALRMERTINVYLPFGYEERKETFPVIYLIDGGLQQDFLPVAGLSALATLSGQYEEFIVVGVETRNRRWELTAPSQVLYDLRAIPLNGGAQDFRRFVVEEVKPYINIHYRTSGEDALLGESLAGLFIVETCLRASDSFDHYIAVSPSVWWKEKELVGAAADLLQSAEFAADRSLYLTVADETDIKAGLDSLVATLKEHAPSSLTWWYEPLPDEHHNTIYHPATLNALRRVFPTE